MERESLERELVQARVLSAIFSRTVKEQVVLKGGMAMRSLFGSVRYTKDIDLGQNQLQSIGALQRVMRSAIAEATTGFLDNVEVSEPKQTDTTARWKISGQTSRGTNIALTIEVSRRGVPTGYITSKLYVPPPEALCTTVAIDVYSVEAIAASKVFCLANPNRTAPRDLYDLDLLIRMDVVPAQELLQGSSGTQTIQLVWDKLEIMTWGQFQLEVLPYLSESVRSRIDEAEFDDMRVRVGTTVENWFGM